MGVGFRGRGRGRGRGAPATGGSGALTPSLTLTPTLTLTWRMVEMYISSRYQRSGESEGTRAASPHESHSLRLGS